MAATVKDIVKMADSQHYKRTKLSPKSFSEALRRLKPTEAGRKQAEMLMKKYRFPD